MKRLKQVKVKEEVNNLWVVIAQFFDTLYEEESKDPSWNAEAERAFDNVGAVLSRYLNRSDKKVRNEPIYKNKKENSVED